MEEKQPKSKFYIIISLFSAIENVLEQLDSQKLIETELFTIFIPFKMAAGVIADNIQSGETPNIDDIDRMNSAGISLSAYLTSILNKVYV